MKSFSKLAVLAIAVFMSGCGKEDVQASDPTHLIMLTETTNGDADASFMSVQTLDECETRATAAQKVFPVANIKYISHYCTYSETSFEPFLHNPEPTGQSYIFALNFAKDGKVLKEVDLYPSLAACKKAKTKVCVISYQNML